MLYGAGVVFKTNDGQVLLLKKPTGVWEFPGGGREPGDKDLLATARREVAEETGVVVPSVPLQLDDSYVTVEPGIRYKTFVYRARRFEPVLSDEHVEYTWQDPASALAYLDLHPGVRAVLAEL